MADPQATFEEQTRGRQLQTERFQAMNQSAEAPEPELRSASFPTGGLSVRQQHEARRSNEQERRSMAERGAEVGRAAGTGLQAAGATMQVGGAVTQAAGAATQTVGRATSTGGQAMMRAGVGLSATGAGAIVGAPLAAVGGLTAAAGAGTEMAGKGASVAGRATRQAGASLQRTGSTLKQQMGAAEQALKAVQAGRGLMAIAEIPVAASLVGIPLLLLKKNYQMIFGNLLQGAFLPAMPLTKIEFGLTFLADFLLLIVLIGLAVLFMILANPCFLVDIVDLGFFNFLKTVLRPAFQLFCPKELLPIPSTTQ